MSFGSFVVKGPQENRTIKPHVLPIYATSSFVFEDINQGIDIFSGKVEAHKYSRYSNPTCDAVADKIAAMEAYGLDIEASAVLVSSGMAAISTLMLGTLKSGDKILTQSNLYGGSTELLTKIIQPFGVEVILSNLNDLNHLEDLVKKDASIKMIYLETPANPTMACVDLEAIANIASKYNCTTAVDNTFCTPYIQQPFAHGIDYVIHSTTKFLNGHGNGIAGIIVGKDPEAMKKKVWNAMKLIGTNSNPFDAWLINNGMKTLELRMQKHCSNAQTVAEYLEKHPKVSQVNYNGLPSNPYHALAKKQMKNGFGGMLSFELKGGLQAGIDMMNAIEFCTLAPTLGDVDTLVLHPASSSHINIDKAVREQNGISDGLVRLSIGIESVEDIIGDLDRSI